MKESFTIFTIFFFFQFETDYNPQPFRPQLVSEHHIFFLFYKILNVQFTQSKMITNIA